jgi:hypothetical protein
MEQTRTGPDDESGEPKSGPTYRGKKKTVGIGEAAALLHLSVSQVRRLCKAYERDPSEGLAFTWTSSWAQHTDTNGNMLRGHRRPYLDAVQALVAAKEQTEQSPPS